VSPIQVALVTRPLAKHRIKTYIQSCVKSSSCNLPLHPEPPGASLCVSKCTHAPGRLVITSHHQAPRIFRVLCLTIFAWRNHPHRQAPRDSSGHCHYFGSLSPDDLPRFARHHTSSANATGFWHFGQVLQNPKHLTHSS